MPERLQIWNAALGHIGEGTILGGLDEPGTHAREINRCYSSVRDSMLSEFPWQFASRTVTLASFTPPPPDSTYAYLLPPACLSMLKVMSCADANAPSVAWRLSGAITPSGDQSVVILTEIPTAYGRYVIRFENEAFWPRPFADAMEWRLAWQISYPITRDLTRREECWRNFLVFNDSAKAEDQRQKFEIPYVAPWIREREGAILPGYPEDDLSFIRQFPVA